MNDFGFRQWLSQEKLMGTRCQACGMLFVPPRSRCAECHSLDLEWSAVKGTGTLAAFTCIAIGTPAMVEQGFDRNHPYYCGVVQLTEGPRVVARIVGLEQLDPETINIGMPLQVRYVQSASNGQTLTTLGFAPAE